MIKCMTILVILTIVLGTFTVACDRNKTVNESAYLPSTSLYKLSFADIWQTTLKVADIEESTAMIESFVLSTDNQREILMFSLSFFATDNEGQQRMYFVVLGKDGLDCRSYGSDSCFSKTRLQPLFHELDKVGLANIAAMVMGSEGFFMDISLEGGDITYNDRSAKIFELSDGELVPISEVSFHTQYPWVTISLAQANSTIPDNVWFLPQDIARADSVKYSGHPS